MSEFVKSQQELRANLTEQIRDVIESAETEGRGLDSAELQKIDRIEGDIRSADEAIQVASRNEERKAQASEASREFVPTVESRDDAEIFRALSRGEVRSHEFMPNAEKRATLVGSANTVPVDFLSQVYLLARQVGPMLDVADVIQRSSGNDLRIPTMTAYSSAAQVAEGGAIGDSEPTFASVLLQPYKQAFIVKIANELLDDAGFNIQATIAEQAGNAIGTQVNALATTGSGSSETEGVVVASGLGVTAASATVLTGDELIELAYSTDGAVRRLPGVGFMANGSTIAAIRKLKDGNGAYIYDPQVGGPDRLLGYDITENPAMADIATAEKTVLFGHFPSYKLVTTGLEVATSSDAYFANDVTAYRFVYRFDGKLTHAGHVKHLVQA